jgi:tRNA A37 threonylcarbamoyladenosine synthetase subunit TsaC/SUA5/YrdC
MSLCYKYYHSIIIALLLSSESLLASPSVLAEQKSLTSAKIVENQVTAQFTNTSDRTDRQIVSDKVTVTVAEVKGNAAPNVRVLSSSTAGASDD